MHLNLISSVSSLKLNKSYFTGQLKTFLFFKKLLRAPRQAPA